MAENEKKLVKKTSTQTSEEISQTLEFTQTSEEKEESPESESDLADSWEELI